MKILATEKKEREKVMVQPYIIVNVIFAFCLFVIYAFHDVLQHMSTLARATIMLVLCWCIIYILNNIFKKLDEIIISLDRK